MQLHGKYSTSLRAKPLETKRPLDRQVAVYAMKFQPGSHFVLYRMFAGVELPPNRDRMLCSKECPSMMS